MANAAPAFLQIQDVVKDYGGVRAVSHASVAIDKGEIFALLGPSGCGKSTLLRLLAGLETPSAGRILLDGRDLADLPPYERPINMMFQSYALFPHLTVWENIAFGLKREGRPKAEIVRRVQAMLELVQLGKLAQRKPHQLSGGQQQRVALARSLARQPQLLLLDEPLGALDKKLRERTQLELVNIVEQVGVTCVMVTHDQEEAMTMASRIAVMDEGRFVQIGTPHELYETPNSSFVADFIGSVNLMAGTLDADAPDHCIIGCADVRHWVGHGIASTPGMAVTVAVRPEKILVGRRPPGETAYNAVRGRIKEIAYLGDLTVYHLALASGALLKAAQPNVQRHRDDELTWGDEAWAHWSASAQVVLTQ
ncbi:MAG TPA: polyamine ABC transporter ATP-binding protein [Rubrivivax sp.]|nr:polyamine ABC transporter ATP-binding protein [Rubrivivax sp.]